MNTASVQITFLNFRQRYGEARIAESQQRMSKGDISDQHPLLARVKIRPSRNYPNFPDLLAWAYHTPIDDIHAYVISLRVFDLWGFGGFFTILLFISDINGIHKSKISVTYIYISFFLRNSNTNTGLTLSLGECEPWAPCYAHELSFLFFDYYTDAWLRTN